MLLIVSTICLWVVVLFNLLLTFALLRRLNAKGGSGKPIIDLPKGVNAPDFTAQNLNGETVTLASFAGRKLAFIFIATYCNPCKDLLPKVKALQERALRGGIEIILVSIEGREVTQRYVEEHSISFPVLIAHQKTNNFTKAYKVSGTPAFCFVTAQGTIYDAGIPHFEGENWAIFEDFLAEDAHLIAAKGGNA